MHQICEERRSLFIAYQLAASNYARIVKQLAEITGTVTEEYDFIRHKARLARQLSIEARERLNQHAMEHKC
jgi:hypothetical protein